LEHVKRGKRWSREGSKWAAEEGRKVSKGLLHKAALEAFRSESGDTSGEFEGEKTGRGMVLFGSEGTEAGQQGLRVAVAIRAPFSA
jgi:hypothetical protein